MIRMSSLELCLPQMMVCINETRGDDPSGTVNDQCLCRWSSHLRCDLADSVALDEQGVFPERHDMVIGLAGSNQNESIPQENGFAHFVRAID